ncbi:hypothetical protein NLM31_36855 [Bradyrhizobium sp. CCGUVB4N]|uniref:hypothetical protein n=1 Tax=Bradyrhizobium sp. CCGUVB4N TaxID=2949631 RepID=UPI0020B3EEEE|nr:hypothetical protein [Bradyrhizobium sp. CCGUVB4N]MCP3385973.1 hypothetical protein [Bradyrhizobium sp. CCGUVB4N]
MTDKAPTNEDNRDLLLEALAALEAIAEEGLTFATEQAVEHVIARIKARVS